MIKFIIPALLLLLTSACNDGPKQENRGLEEISFDQYSILSDLKHSIKVGEINNEELINEFNEAISDGFVSVREYDPLFHMMIEEIDKHKSEQLELLKTDLFSSDHEQ